MRSIGSKRRLALASSTYKGRYQCFLSFELQKYPVSPRFPCQYGTIPTKTLNVSNVLPEFYIPPESPQLVTSIGFNLPLPTWKKTPQYNPNSVINVTIERTKSKAGSMTGEDGYKKMATVGKQNPRREAFHGHLTWSPLTWHALFLEVPRPLNVFSPHAR